VVLTGAGEKAFVAGADIAEMQELSPLQAQAFAEMGGALGTAIETSEKAWIAAVNGFALGGGCELALACDFIYAAETAKFGQPEVKLGVIPGFGGTQRLARRVAREAKDWQGDHRGGGARIGLPTRCARRRAETKEDRPDRRTVRSRSRRQAPHPRPRRPRAAMRSSAPSPHVRTADQRRG
jgi:hypothetical protein